MAKKNKKDYKLSSNMEDYLEAIIFMKQNNGVARVRDISRFLDVRKPSVTSALSVLSEKGLIVHERYGYVDLTPEGEEVAGRVKKKHDMLIKFLSEILKLDLRTAQEDACKMEHTISPETFERLTKFIEFVKTCPVGDRSDERRDFDRYFKTGKRTGRKVSPPARKIKSKK